MATKKNKKIHYLLLNSNLNNVMKKNTIAENIRKCQAYARLMPKTISESINFEDDEDIIASDQEDDNEEEYEEDEPTQIPDDNVTDFVDETRRKALCFMSKLADKPDSKEYLICKKIWLLCDKKPEDSHEKDIQ